ncbi:CoA transferase [Nostoc sp. 106C]|uniref:CoA transferase n=1 Tax=Nostoc sp. 106C TaxID=1932667 RepID=UPI000A3C76B2|nr:CoA transferase [Nostoc sp. 106C]OUL34414.1 acyl-CoA transferase [Nostoc sp. 106C]
MARYKTIIAEIQEAFGGSLAAMDILNVSGIGALASVYAVTDLAIASIASAGMAVAEFIAIRSGKMPLIQVDRRLASMWFSRSLRPIGWQLPQPWDAVAGDYKASDNWIRLHTNAPHHRRAALQVLGCSEDREAVTKAVASWQASELEDAIVSANGCAAVMRSAEDWSMHAQGRAVATEPLLHISATDSAHIPNWLIPAGRPLEGIRVLDLTRVLAGPVATRFLASYGAQVLRIDPIGWEEPGAVPEVVLGKRCARLDLKNAKSMATLKKLLSDADVIIHGYRTGALARLGLDSEERQKLRPGLVDISLNAYGWSGPWKLRRGFDSLVQMSSGIAHTGMVKANKNCPFPLPVQALDHATGYLLAAAAIRGLIKRVTSGQGMEVRASLARTAAILACYPVENGLAAKIEAENRNDLAPAIEATAWGAAQRLKPPLVIEGCPMYWDLPSSPLGSSLAEWL